MKRLSLSIALIALVSLIGCSQQSATRPAAGKAKTAPPVASRRMFLQTIERPRVPLDPQESPAGAVQGIQQVRFSYATQSGMRVPGVLLLPPTQPGSAAPARHPVVIAMHGTGGNKNDQLPFLRQVVPNGFIGVAIDGRYHGERAISAERFADLNAYETAILKAYCDTPKMMRTVFGDNATPVQEPFYPLYYDTVWDIMRLIDYLQTRPDVDPSRIGIYGVSKGGIEAYLAAAVDPRIAAAVPTISVQTFRYGLMKNAWKGRVGTFQKAFNAAADATGITNPDSRFVEVFYDRVMPGIADWFDGPAMVPLIAPRPLLIVNSDNDANTPFPGVQLAAQATRDAYNECNPPAPERFQQIVQPGAGHRVTAESQHAAVEFFVKWLGKSGS
jgi:cephalosporin-C deacetylase-like acetyl esterase